MSLSGQDAFVVGGIFNVTPPAPVNGQRLPFQLDSEGNLLVNVAIGGGGGGGTQYVDGVTQSTPTGTVALGKNASNVLHSLSLDASGNLNVNLAAGSISGGNAAAGLTGAAVPASADYVGFNSGGNLVGVSTANALPVAQQGTVTVTGAVSITGTPAVDVTDRSARLLGHVTVDNATLAVTQSTSPWVTSDSHLPAAAALSDALANPTTTEIGANLLGWDATNTVWRRVQVDAATGTLKVDGSGSTQPISGSVSITGTPTVDVTDRAARLVGVVYGSQAQQLKQTATNFNLQVELATGGTLYDARLQAKLALQSVPTSPAPVEPSKS